MKSAERHHVLPVLEHPSAPQTLEQSGLSFDLVLQLLLKTLHFSGELSGADLGRRLGVPYSVIEPVLQHLKLNNLVEIHGGGLVAGPSFIYAITDGGRNRALLFLEQNLYVGTAPVPFAQYEKYMRQYARTMPRSATRERVKEAFQHLVLSQRVLDQLGPAINGRHSLFVYGPPGNGKTVISQAIRNLLDGDLAVPRAVEAEGHIIQVFDPVNHETLPAAAEADVLDAGEGEDGRWVRCRRPLITVGGELDLGPLDLAFSETSKFYQSPIQMMANGGVLVIDDFGRQKCTPAELLNRWITPLESRVDYLTLKTGQKLAVPFVVLIVFATNIRPADLVDEAFLRRIHYKVYAESPSVADFKEIFERCCREREIPYSEELVEYLLVNFYYRRGITMRGCHPRDLIDHALSLADYLGAARVLTRDLMMAACAGYFVDEQEARASATS
jgi:predicted ATPase with chaperone activity